MRGDDSTISPRAPSCVADASAAGSVSGPRQTIGATVTPSRFAATSTDSRCADATAASKKHGDTRQPGHQFSEQLELLGAYLGLIEEGSGDVAAGPRKTRRVTSRNRIGLVIETDNRDDRARCAGCPQSIRAICVDDLAAGCDELAGEFLQPLFRFRVAMIDN